MFLRHNDITTHYCTSLVFWKQKRFIVLYPKHPFTNVRTIRPITSDYSGFERIKNVFGCLLYRAVAVALATWRDIFFPNVHGIFLRFFEILTTDGNACLKRRNQRTNSMPFSSPASLYFSRPISVASKMPLKFVFKKKHANRTPKHRGPLQKLSWARKIIERIEGLSAFCTLAYVK